MKNSDFVILFECCKVVKGFKKSVLYDLQRHQHRIIPNDLADMLMKFNRKKVDDIRSYYPVEYWDTIKENLEILIEGEYIFLTKNVEAFPELSMKWESPSYITNAILELGDYLNSPQAIWDQLEKLGCEHIELRSYTPIDITFLKRLIESTLEARILSIDLIIPYSEELFVDINNLFWEHPRLSKIILHSSSKDMIVEEVDSRMLMLTQAVIDSNSHCGNICSSNFVVNVSSFTESQRFNSCLNGKLSIDKNGNIMNCLSMKKIYANINEVDLVELARTSKFQKLWTVNKDNIKVCKDCEYRYMCHDCRAYLDDPNDIYSKPLKCGYNPYLGEWNEWSQNPAKKKAIEFYGMQELVSVIN